MITLLKADETLG